MEGMAVLENHIAMRGGGADGRHSPMAESGGVASLIEDGTVDQRVPRVVGGMVLGSLITLFLLRVAGFRFSFGAQIGGGS